MPMNQEQRFWIFVLSARLAGVLTLISIVLFPRFFVGPMRSAAGVLLILLGLVQFFSHWRAPQGRNLRRPGFLTPLVLVVLGIVMIVTGTLR